MKENQIHCGTVAINYPIFNCQDQNRDGRSRVLVSVRIQHLLYRIAKPIFIRDVGSNINMTGQEVKRGFI